MNDKTERAVASGLPVRSIRLTVVEGASSGDSSVFSEDRVSVGSADSNQVVISQPTVSRYHLELRREGAAVRVTDLGSTNGTRIGNVSVRDASVSVALPAKLTLGDVAVKLEDGEVVLQDLHQGEELGGLRGRSASMRRVMDNVRTLSQSDVSVLLIGESGTGKELLAQAIHDESERKDSPFVVVDCAAIPPSLFAAELFGHERGAFTGAERQRAGALERAQGGTVFLDEIGELPPSLQASLLGALERRRFVRLGGQQEVPVDVRLVSATNRDLRKDVNAGTFRLDLFYRVAVVLLDIPPLRQRTEDIEVLVRHFAEQAGAADEVDSLFPPELMQELAGYSWPGNVRELRNMVAGAIALKRPPSVESSAELLGDSPSTESDIIGSVLHMRYRDARSALLNEFEQRYLGALLERSEGNVRRAAREGQMNRSYLIELLKRHGIR